MPNRLMGEVATKLLFENEHVGRSFTIPVEPMKVIYVPGGNRETAVNRSSVRYREFLVELKDAARGDAG